MWTNSKEIVPHFVTSSALALAQNSLGILCVCVVGGVGAGGGGGGSVGAHKQQLLACPPFVTVTIDFVLPSAATLNWCRRPFA